MSETVATAGLPLIPLRNSVLYPTLTMPFSIGRTASVAAVEAALASEDKLVLVVAQRDPDNDDPGLGDLHPVGTKAVLRHVSRGENTVQAILQGVERVRLDSVVSTYPYVTVAVTPIPAASDSGTQVEALAGELKDLARKFQTLAHIAPQLDLAQVFSAVDDPTQLVYMIAAALVLKVPEAQSLLEAATRAEALRLLLTHLSHEVQVWEVRNEIATSAQSEMSREQREYLLRQQMRAIQEQLGDKNPEQAEVAELRRRFDEAKLPDDIRKEADKELGRLERLPSAAPEYQVVRSHLELVLELPWTALTDDNLDLARAREILNEDHFGLSEVKDRILEQLAVMRRNPESKAPILCFVGPPGVGKTSLGQSIARALGRKFEHFSLGGLHDEAELRGHRRTYVGAMPGRIIQAVRRAGVRNPMLLLDEIDKLGQDFRGDPAAALLEILDPAQNNSFRDNYLDLPFDLSKVFFVTTANSLDTIPRPLLDRMEVIRLSGYSEEEKLEIARRYLAPRRRKEAGFSDEEFPLSDETLRALIRRYTRESGVRELERVIARLASKAALRLAEGKSVGSEPGQGVAPADLEEVFGPERFRIEEARRNFPAGVATGLAWTETGGEVLYVEALRLPEGRELLLTGQLGDVMQESARAALSYVLAHSEELGLEHAAANVHVHVPAGATPKDGPSAGVTMATVLCSLFSGRPVRSDTAMTGEVTLTGLVLPVGGIKEKCLAARRAGIRRIILPKDNAKDLRELPDEVRADLELILAEHVGDVFGAAIQEVGPATAAATGNEIAESDQAPLTQAARPA
ncbi:MAG: endopeptidase La [Deltaproteobacteria bacterium]|nr:endopeptidase La [Deltaproteobacteria bacterium]